MSVASDMFEAAAGGVLYEVWAELAVTYVHQPDPVNSLASLSESYSMIVQSSTDVGGGSRQLQQPTTWRLRVADATRAPRRGDTITHDGTTWTVVDVTDRRGSLEYRLTTAHNHTRG